MSLGSVARRVADLARTPGGRVLGALAGGYTLALGFPPFGFWPILFITPLAFWWCCAQQSIRLGILTGLAFGIAMGTSVWWFMEVGWYAGLASLMLPGSAGPAAGALAAYLYRNGIRSPAAGAATWLTFEAMRSTWPWGGQGWARVGYGLVDLDVVRASAAWVGVTGVGFMVAAVSFGAVAAVSSDPTRRRHGVLLTGAAVAAATTFTILPNGTRPAGDPIELAAIQGNWMQGPPTEEQKASRAIARNHYRLARTIAPGPELVVFPESAFNADPATDYQTREVLVETAQRLNATVVFNASRAHPDTRGWMNTNFAMSPNGVLQGAVPKRHLIPFGEHNPWPFQVRPISKIPDPVTSWTPHDDRRLFRHGSYQFATAVCYEAEYHNVSLQSVRQGANFLVVAANNHSFKRSANSAQHLQTSQMRAAELGRPVIHASISGHSAVIDHNGVILTKTRLYGEDMLYGSIVPMRGATPYSLWGDLPACLVIAWLAVHSVRHRFQLHDITPDPEPLRWATP